MHSNEEDRSLSKSVFFSIFTIVKERDKDHGRQEVYRSEEIKQQENLLLIGDRSGAFQALFMRSSETLHSSVSSNARQTPMTGFETSPNRMADILKGVLRCAISAFNVPSFVVNFN